MNTCEYQRFTSLGSPSRRCVFRESIPPLLSFLTAQNTSHLAFKTCSPMAIHLYSNNMSSRSGARGEKDMWWDLRNAPLRNKSWFTLAWVNLSAMCTAWAFNPPTQTTLPFFFINCGAFIIRVRTWNAVAKSLFTLIVETLSSIRANHSNENFFATSTLQYLQCPGPFWPGGKAKQATCCLAGRCDMISMYLWYDLDVFCEIWFLYHKYHRVLNFQDQGFTKGL